MTCPKCGAILEIELVFTGGCHGHKDDYCYCDKQDVHVVWLCRAELKTPIRNLFKGYCTWRSDPIAGLTDEYAIARWIKDRINLQ